MNKLVMAMMAAGVALASTLPAQAQEPYNDHAPDYGTGHGDGAGYGYSGSNGSYNPSGSPYISPSSAPGGFYALGSPGFYGSR